MLINGEEYFEGKIFEGIPEDLFNYERKEMPNGGRYKKAGGICIGEEIVNGMKSQMNKCSRYLEIGTFDGIALSVYAQQFPKTEFHAVDAFTRTKTTGGGCLKYFIQNCKDFDNIYLYVGKSVDVLKTIPGKFQIIFVDGEHSYENVVFDMFYSYETLLDEGGALVFHDYSLSGVGPAVDELMRKYGLSIRKDGFRCNHFRKKKGN